MEYTYDFVYINGHGSRMFTKRKFDIETLLSKDFHVFTNDNGKERTIVNMHNVVTITEKIIETENEK